MTDVVHDLTNVIVEHLATMHPAEAGARSRARRIAVDIANRYHLIPASECEPVHYDYMLPAELVEDAAAIEQAHASVIAHAVAEAVRNGFLVITRPEHSDLPSPPGAPDMKRFQARAIGWRVPDPAASKATL